MLQKYKGEIMLVMMTILAALGWIFSKNAIMRLPTMGFNSMRFGFAALLFLPFAYPQLKKLTKQQWRNSAIVGLCLLCSISFYCLALKITTELGKGAFISSLSMLVAPIVSRIIFQDTIKKSYLYSFFAALIGLYFLNADIRHMTLGLDVVFFFCSACLAAFQFTMNNRFAKTVPVLSLTTITLGLVGIVHGAYSFLFEAFPERVDPEAWFWLFLSVTLATCIRFLLLTYGQKYSDMASSATIMILEPVWTMILSVWLMGEAFTTNKFIGACLILAALFIYRFDYKLNKYFH